MHPSERGHLRTPQLLTALVATLGADVLRVVGTDQLINRLTATDGAGPGALTFCRRADQNLSDADRSRASAIIVPDVPCEAHHATLIFVANPRLSFIKLAAALLAETVDPSIHPTSLIDASAAVDSGAQIGAYAIIGPRCVVGPGTVIGAHVVLHRDVRIGANCKIDPGTIIGGEGFGFERDQTGRLINFPHVGGVIIGNGVDIGANTCIDRGTFGDTMIGDGARIDNLAHISHNVRVGAHAVVVTQTTICGSVEIGEGAWVSPNASVLNQRKIGRGAMVGMGAVVLTDVPDCAVVAGNPAKLVR